MMAVDFQEANVTYGKPKGWTDEQCHSIRAFKTTDENGVEKIITVWMSSKEDIDAISSGRPIIMTLCSSVMIPVSLHTYDENLQPNV